MKETSMRLVSLPLVLALLVASAGCGAKDQTPRDATRYDYPIGSTDVARGEAVFMENCNGCHPGGQAGYGPALVDHPEPVAEVRMMVREGKGRMPSFGADKISDDDLEALLAYVDGIGGVGN
jgi:mono/diheme cytochrome c family protein